jgi:hypothetical protein
MYAIGPRWVRGTLSAPFEGQCPYGPGRLFILSGLMARARYAVQPVDGVYWRVGTCSFAFELKADPIWMRGHSRCRLVVGAMVSHA